MNNKGRTEDAGFPVTARVAHYREFTETVAAGTSVRATFEIDDGDRFLQQELIEVVAGGTLIRDGNYLETLLFVVFGAGLLTLAGSHDVTAGTAVRVPPHHAYEITACEGVPLLIVAVLVRGSEMSSEPQPVTISLAHQQSDRAAAAREYRMLFGPGSGCTSATQFVGYIPPGRAPDHYHEYDELIFVLDGSGLVHTATDSTPAVRGTCIRLPTRVVHSVENVAAEPMAVLGVFCPAGSPAAAYYPDGTAARPSTARPSTDRP